MSDLDRSWLLIPLFNEAEVIGDVVTDARQVFPHVLVVDDGSRDGSAAIAAKAGARLVQHPINLGQGAALQTGFEYFLHFTSGEYLVTFDADGQHLVSDALDMVNLAAEKDLAVVFGSRFLASEVEAGPAKRVVLRTAAAVTRWRTGMNLTDAHNGLRLLRRDAVGAVNLTQNRMAHASQIISQVAASGLPWAESPVHIKYTDYSRAKGQSLLNSVNILVDLIVN